MSSLGVFCHSFEINGANNFVFTLVRSLKHVHTFTIYSHRHGKMSEKFISEGAKTVVLKEGDEGKFITIHDAIVINSLIMSKIAVECHNRKVPHALIVHETWDKNSMEKKMINLWGLNSVTPDDVIMALKNSSNIVFPAHYLKKVYKDLVEKDRSKTIYCTIDTASIDHYGLSNNRKSIRKNLHVTEETLWFLQVGTITRRKSQLSTVRAFHRLVERLGHSNKIKLTFVGARDFRPGEAEYIKQIIDYVKVNKIDHLVEILPVQDNANKFFLAADILVHPSINEVLPLAILEACYCRMAVIVSNLDGMPELISNELNGLLVDPFDENSIYSAMLKLATDEKLRKFIGKNARTMIEKNHSKADFANNYIDLFDAVVCNGANYYKK